MIYFLQERQYEREQNKVSSPFNNKNVTEVEKDVTDNRLGIANGATKKVNESIKTKKAPPPPV